MSVPSGGTRTLLIAPGQMIGWSSYARPGRFHRTLLHGGHHELIEAPDDLIAELDEGMRTSCPQPIAGQ